MTAKRRALAAFGGVCHCRRRLFPMPHHESDNALIISSIVVHTRPDRCKTIRDALSSLSCVTIIKELDHKLAVVLETISTDSAAELAERIRSLDGVTTLELVAHFFEEEASEQ